MRENIKKIHFVGSEGVSMKMLKKISEKNGFEVSGSDISTGGHDAVNVEGADLVVYSAAIADDNVELIRAAELNIPTISRADFLSKICGDYDFSVAVSGSHGKTTTTAMLWEVLKPLNPTVHIGGNYNGQIGRAGGRDLFITEACEYKRSFLSLSPDIAVILNVDLDHTDCYGSLLELQNTFGKFAAKAKRLVVYNGDNDGFLTDILSNIPIKDGEICVGEKDKTCVILKKVNVNPAYKYNSEFTSSKASRASKKRRLQKRLQTKSTNIKKDAPLKKVRSVGFSRKNHYYATCVSSDKKGRYSFCVHEFGRRLGRVSLSVAGRHNLFNALAVIAVSRYLGLSFGRIVAGLSRFYGAERRMEFLGYRDGCAVFSDYAHHPSEISMSLLSARESCYKHVSVVFEPHTYTRTQSFFDGFIDELAKADQVIILPIYAAREQAIDGVDSRLIAGALQKKGVNTLFFEDYPSAERYLKEDLKDDGILLFMGAGSIDTLARRFVK